MDEKYKTDEYSIKGCQNKLWIACECQNNKIKYFAESDSRIIKGMLALIFKVVNEQPVSEVAKTVLYFLDEIGLTSNLSPSRGNGLLALIVRKINELAKIHSGS